MARKTKVLLIDDIDGKSLAVDTIHFGLDDVSYEIDLNPTNSVMLRTILKAYIKKARKVTGTPNGDVEKGG